MSVAHEAFAMATAHLASSRRSVIRVVNGPLAQALARGLVPHVAMSIEAGLRDDLGRLDGDPAVEIVWTAHAGQPHVAIERLSWCPGTPLPDQTLFVSCMASAPLGEATQS